MRAYFVIKLTRWDQGSIRNEGNDKAEAINHYLGEFAVLKDRSGEMTLQARFVISKPCR